MSDENPPTLQIEEYVNVRLSRKQYDMLIGMLDREQAVSWVWKWLKSFLFIAAGGLVSIYTLLEYWKSKP